MFGTILGILAPFVLHFEAIFEYFLDTFFESVFGRAFYNFLAPPKLKKTSRDALGALLVYFWALFSAFGRSGDSPGWIMEPPGSILEPPGPHF